MKEDIWRLRERERERQIDRKRGRERESEREREREKDECSYIQEGMCVFANTCAYVIADK